MHGNGRVSLSPSGQGGVGVLAGAGVVEEHEAPVDGDALGVVNRGGVAVGEVSGLEVGERDGELFALVGSDDERSSDRVDVVDSPAGAVEDPDAVVVVQGEDFVADGEGAAAALDSIGIEVALLAQDGPGPAVEIVDVCQPRCGHQDVVAIDAAVHPVLDKLGSGLVIRRGDVDTVVIDVGVNGGVWVTGAQLSECGALPLVGLATILGQLDGAEPGTQPTEGAAGLDLGKLIRVADQHDLGPCRSGLLVEAHEFALADHCRLVHHDHGPGRREKHH